MESDGHESDDLTPMSVPAGRLPESDQSEVRSAVETLVRAVELDPDNPLLLQALADAYQQAGSRVSALRQLSRLMDLELATGPVWKQAAQLLAEVGEHAQAVGAYRRYLEIEGQDGEACHEYARSLHKLGDLTGAVTQLQRSAVHCDSLAPWLSLAILAPSYWAFDHSDVLQMRRTFASKLCEHSSVVHSRRTGKRSTGRLRIGYVSSWFDHENYMKPVWGLINRHNREAFQIHLFSDTGLERGLPGYLPQSGDRVHETAELDNAALAQWIENEQIDVLVDLNGYSTPARLGLFLTSPAPVTVAWFNMYATSGLSGIGYLVGDADTVYPEEEPFYSETVLRLPQSYLSFHVTHNAPPLVAPPCCRAGHITFGCLATQYKISAPVLDAWATILHAVPTSRLLVGNVMLGSVCNRDYLAAQFESRGIERGRVEFRGRAEHRVFLEYYNAIDIALDTFPYNGGTTTMEALWQGVPVVTFAGDRWASRTSASLMRGSPCGSFVAADLAGYQQVAIRLASDPDVGARLQVLRRSLRQALLSCPVCNTESFARAMELLYRDAVSRV